MENNSEDTGAIRMIVPIPCADKFFRLWLEVLKPQHQLTDRETDLLAAFVAKRHELQRTNLSQDMIDAILMSSQSKKEIRKSVKISTAYFQRIMAKFRKRDILIPDSNIKGGKINPRYIPVLKDDDKNIGILFMFIDPNGT